MGPNALCDLLAVYGTLRQRSIFQKLPVAVSRLHVVGRGLIRGRLFLQGKFPGLIENRGVAHVELFQVVDQSVWFDLDLYEGFDSNNLRSSLFIRRQVRLLNPRLIAWAYFLNRNIPLGLRIDPERRAVSRGAKPISQLAVETS
jgi:gamma-glutamylcyclotransferase (GGCT)/AIG2-like uncharacterized protein YtfP